MPRPTAVEEEEQRVLAGRVGALAVPPGPEPVAEEGDGRGDHRGDGLRGERLACRGRWQVVEEREVDEEGEPAHRGELAQLADEVTETVEQRADRTRAGLRAPGWSPVIVAATRRAYRLRARAIAATA